MGTRQLQRVVDQLAVDQIDSVNVLARSQYLPFFARLGAYDMALLDRFRDNAWGGMRRVAAEHPQLVEQVLAEITAHGPMTAVELEKAMACPYGRPGALVGASRLCGS